MKQFFKKVLCSSLAMMLVLGMTSCSDKTVKNDNSNSEKPASNQTSEEKTKLHFWHLWTSETDAMRIETEKAVADYMKEHTNVEIEIHMLENEAYKTKISTEFAGSAKGIDLFFYWGGGRAGKLQKAGKLLTIEDYLSDEVKKSIKPGADQQFRYDGKLYALPMYSWIMPLYCNTELFDKAGLKPPKTYEDLLESSKKLQAAGVEVPLAMGVKESWQAAFVYEALALREVGAANVLKMINGEVKFEDPGYLEAAKKTQELYKSGLFGKNPMELATADADQLFLTGKSAMRLQGNWFTEAIYVDKNSIVEGKVTAVPFPLFAKGKETDYCGGYIDSIYINKNTKNPEIAVDFNAFLCKRLATARHETGQGFTGFLDPVDESKLQPVAKEVAAIASKLVDGVIAWDTALDENTATTHLEEVQSLFTDSGNPQSVFEAHVEAINNR